MLVHNERNKNNFFNLKAMMCGDPYTAPMTQRTHMYIVPESTNVLDDSNMYQVSTMIRRCRSILGNNFYTSEEKGDACSSIMGYIESVSGDVFPYDNRIFGSDWSPIEDPTTNYFTISGKVNQIYAAIHVTDSTKTPVFEMGSSAVATAFADDQMIDYSYYIEELYRLKLPMLIYAGEFDAQDGPKTLEFWMRRLTFEGNEAFWSQSR
jgi:hypothetical protein